MQPPEQPPWQSARPFPALPTGRLHVWYAGLAAPDGALKRLHDLLEPFERARAARLHRALHRRRFTAARGLLRTLLGLYNNCAPQDIRFDFGPRGKPSLRGRPGLCFNASDSGDHALFGFCEGRELGVDIEALPRVVNDQRIARRKFAASEYRALQQWAATDPAGRVTAFLRCWTRKEAYGKARGAGIYYPMKQVVLCDDLRQTQLRVADHEQPHDCWTVRQLQLPVAAVATLVVRGEGGRLQCYDGEGLI